MMSPDRAQALQDTFLDHLRKHKVPVTVFLANGIRLQGTVTAFDSIRFCSVGTACPNSSTSTRSRPSCTVSRSGPGRQTSQSPHRRDRVGRHIGQLLEPSSRLNRSTHVLAKPRPRSMCVTLHEPV